MKVYVIEIPAIILEIFTVLFKLDKFDDRIRDGMEIVLKSAAERILYAETNSRNGYWRLLSNNSYQLLDHCLNNFMLSFRRDGRSFHPDDYRVDVELRGQHALFIFEKING